MKSNHLFLLTIVFSFFSASSVVAQKKNKEKSADVVIDHEYQKQREIFKMALKYNDLEVAKQAVYEMMIAKPEETSLKDSLAIVYYSMGAYPQSLLLSKEILEANPDKDNILEIKAVSEQNLGLLKDALKDYETVYAKSKDVYHLYQITTLQYELKRFGECKTNIEKIVSDRAADSLAIPITAGEVRQQVPLTAAAYNIMGVVHMEVNDKVQAKISFENALKVFPDFRLAQANLKAIEQMSASKE